MENQQEQAATPEAQAGKEVQNTLGVIKVVEGLFNALRRASYPLETHDAVVAGMNFLAQFHTQLVNGLPPALVEEIRKAQAGVPAAPVAEAPKPEEATSGQPA